MAHKTISYFFLLISFVCVLDANSQSVKANIDKDTITLGDQIKLTLQLDDVNPDRFQLTDWFRFTDTLQRFKLVEKSGIDSLLFNGVYLFRQSFIITSFDSGVYAIPPFTVLLNERFTNESFSLSTEEIFVSISTLDVTNLKIYNDITGIISVEETYNKLNYYFLGIVVSGLLLTGFVLFIYRRRKKARSLTVNDEITILEEAKLQLDSLAINIKTNSDTPKVFYNKLYHIIRVFYSKLFHQPSVINCTTSEWILLSDKLEIGTEQRKEFIYLLNKSDEVRFTESILLEEFEESIRLAGNLAEYLHKLKQGSNFSL